MKRFDELDILVPVSLDLDWPKNEDIIREIKEQHDRYGFTRFILACPGAGWRVDKMSENEIQNLRSEVANLQMQLNSVGTVKYPMATAYTAGQNPFFQCNCGC